MIFSCRYFFYNYSLKKLFVSSFNTKMACCVSGSSSSSRKDSMMPFAKAKPLELAGSSCNTLKINASVLSFAATKAAQAWVVI